MRIILFFCLLSSIAKGQNGDPLFDKTGAPSYEESSSLSFIKVPFLKRTHDDSQTFFSLCTQIEDHTTYDAFFKDTCFKVRALYIQTISFLNVPLLIKRVHARFNALFLHPLWCLYDLDQGVISLSRCCFLLDEAFKSKKYSKCHEEALSFLKKWVEKTENADYEHLLDMHSFLWSPSLSPIQESSTPIQDLVFFPMNEKSEEEIKELICNKSISHRSSTTDFDIIPYKSKSGSHFSSKEDLSDTSWWSKGWLFFRFKK